VRPCSGSAGVHDELCVCQALHGPIVVPAYDASLVTELELVQDARAGLGEGPVWDHRTGELVWVDIMAGLVHRLDVMSGLDRPLTVGQPVGAVCLREAGGYAVALRDGVAVLAESGDLASIAGIESDIPEHRCNDGKCDASGRLWVGTMRFDERPGGALYRVASDHSVSPMVTGLGLSNGLGWSLDGSAMYLIDSLAGGLDLFDFDESSGTLVGRRRLVSFDPREGFADGMTVDSEGFVWVALYGGGAVRRYSPSGQLAEVIELPVSQATSCTFGGEGLQDLFITTATQRLSPARLAAQPGAGGVFRCRPGPTGLPANLFAG